MTNDEYLTNLTELHCPSIDVCAICGDSYCDGISCIQCLDADNIEEQPEIEQIQTWIRLGRIQEQANAFLAHVENRRVVRTMRADTTNQPQPQGETS